MRLTLVENNDKRTNQMHTDDYDDRRRDYETPDDKLKTAIIKLGEVVSIKMFLSFPSNLTKACSPGSYRRNSTPGAADSRPCATEYSHFIGGISYWVLYTFLLSRCISDKLSRVTEQPYKIPFYAALLRLLHNPSELAIAGDSPLGRLVLEDFWKGFQSYLDKVEWRETRLCVSN